MERPASGRYFESYDWIWASPLRAIDWSLEVVLLGWLMVSVAKRAGVMRLTWPETTPPPSGDPTAGLNPLLYSLDVFLPFVNLHQEH